MIKIRVRNGSGETSIQFPISEKELCEKLDKEPTARSSAEPPFALVTGIYWPEEFSVLEGHQVNLDEMNYLARRMDSFDTLEMDQFLIAISKLDDPSIKDLINLTFNLDHFTLVQNISNYGKIGRAYVMNTEGAAPANDEDDPKYVSIGKDLIDRGLVQITERGLLIYDDSSPLAEIYDGQTFPEYFYKGALASAEVHYNGRTELLLLPDEELAIRKAMARLGAPSAGDCQISFCLNNVQNAVLEARLDSIIRSEGLYGANLLLQSLDIDSLDWDKLTAIIEMTEAQNASLITALVEHLDDFTFMPEVCDGDDLAHYLVDNVEKYRINPAMEAFFDFPAFGEMLAKEYRGSFVKGGFVFYHGDRSLGDLLEEHELEDADMTMGGM